MLNNISDYLSILTLIFATIYALRICLSAFIVKDRDEATDSRLKLIRDYIDNEEE